MIVKQEDQIEALSGILAQQMLEPNYKVREYFVRTYVCLHAHVQNCLCERVNRVATLLLTIIA